MQVIKFIQCDMSRLRELLKERNLLPQKAEPNADQVLAMQPKQMQDQVRAQERRLLREADQRQGLAMKQTLAAQSLPVAVLSSAP